MGRKNQRQEKESDEGDALAYSEGGTAYKLHRAKPTGRPKSLQQGPDPVGDLVAGQYDPDIVDEVRRYSAPAWEAEDSSLDEIDDLSDYFLHGFRLNPEAYDEVQAAAQRELDALESAKGPVDPEVAARVAARRELVEGRSPQEIAWLKHKAYHRALEALRAQRRRREDASGEGGDADAPGTRAAYLQSKGVPLDVVPADLVDITPAAAAARAAAEAEAVQRDAQARDPRVEAAYTRALADAAATSAPWVPQPPRFGRTGAGTGSSGVAYDPAWMSQDMARHPEVVGLLAAAVGSATGASVKPRDSPAAAAIAAAAAESLAVAKAGGMAALEAQADAALAAAVRAQQRIAQAPLLAVAAEAVAGPPSGRAEYVEAYKQRLARERAAARYRTARSSVFWLALAAAVGKGAAQWWQERRRRERRAAAAAQARAARRGGARAGRASSLASSEATLPSVYEGRA